MFRSEYVFEMVLNVNKKKRRKQPCRITGVEFLTRAGSSLQITLLIPSCIQAKSNTKFQNSKTMPSKTT